MPSETMSQRAVALYTLFQRHLACTLQDGVQLHDMDLLRCAATAAGIQTHLSEMHIVPCSSIDATSPVENHLSGPTVGLSCLWYCCTTIEPRTCNQQQTMGFNRFSQPEASRSQFVLACMKHLQLLGVCMNKLRNC